MGRVKLKIKKLQSSSRRQVTYSKRRNGMLKKAKELSVLCDVDILLLMFSPFGRPTLFHTGQSDVENVIAKFARLAPHERAKRKMESLQALKKTFKKLDHDVDVQEFLHSNNQNIEGLTDRVAVLQSQLIEVHKRLSRWTNFDKINDTGHLRQLEDSLRESISHMLLHKGHSRENQLVLPEYTCQDRMPLPLVLAGVEESNLINYLPEYSRFFARQVDICDPGQENSSLNEYAVISSTSSSSLQDNEKFKPDTGMNLAASSAAAESTPYSFSSFGEGSYYYQNLAPND